VSLPSVELIRPARPPDAPSIVAPAETPSRPAEPNTISPACAVGPGGATETMTATAASLIVHTSELDRSNARAPRVAASLISTTSVANSAAGGVVAAAESAIAHESADVRALELERPAASEIAHASDAERAPARSRVAESATDHVSDADRARATSPRDAASATLHASELDRMSPPFVAPIALSLIDHESAAARARPAGTRARSRARRAVRDRPRVHRSSSSS
jgi:hypothetical protein